MLTGHDLEGDTEIFIPLVLPSSWPWQPGEIFLVRGSVRGSVRGLIFGVYP